MGGVSFDNFADWIGAGIEGFGIGTAVYALGGDVETVWLKARKAVQAYDAAVAT